MQIPACRHVPAWANRYEVCASSIISSCHVETVVCLSNKNAKPRDYVEIGVDAEDYYRIKDSENKKGK